MGFTVWIHTPLGDQHWQGLVEVARGIKYSLEQLGHIADLYSGPYVPSDRGRLIVFNAHRLVSTSLPAETIIFNTEQVPTTLYGHWSPYIDALRTYPVWDYSLANIERLKAHKVNRIAHCPVGYYPGLLYFEPSLVDVPPPPVDVLFFGSYNTRRQEVLLEIAKRRIRVKHLFGEYVLRDKWIQKSKIVLNIHYYDNPIFEIFRVAPLLANGKCVVSENGSVDKQLDDLGHSTTAYVPYYKLADECERLLNDEASAKTIAENGQQIFQKIDQVKAVMEALGAC